MLPVTGLKIIERKLLVNTMESGKTFMTSMLHIWCRRHAL